MRDWKDFDKFYNKIVSDIYHEPDSLLTMQVVDKMLPGFLDILRAKNSRILDVGCGSGYALEKMKERGFENVEGLTLNDEDIKDVTKRGFKVHQTDFNFMDFKDEFNAVWMRHALEHSPFPFYTIWKLNIILKNGGLLYVEMPQPHIDRLKNSERILEKFPNHYSIMGSEMYKSLFSRAGFRLVQQDEIFLSNMKQPGKTETFNETYDWYLLQKVEDIPNDD